MSADAEGIYLDYAATTPVDPRVAARMAGFLGTDGVFGNPSSLHPWGRAAAAAVAEAAEAVGTLVGGEPEGVIWTSGATEANNLALLGAARFALHRGRGNHVVTTRVEHPAVLEPVEQLRRQGAAVTLVEPDGDGAVPAERILEAVGEATALVSVMHVNNETGVRFDIPAIAAGLRAHPALLHVDAVQSAGRLPIDVTDWGVDLLSLSAHKLYGPKGVGVLWARPRPRLRLEPLVHGGGHQRGDRPGTLATHQIVGMGEACRIAAREGVGEAARLASLRDRLWKGLEALGGVRRLGRADGGPHILNVAFAGVHGEALQAELAELGVSAGSACSTGDPRPSHVLRAMGVPQALAHAALRFSVGRWSTEQEIDQVVQRVGAAVTRLRGYSPLWRDHQAGASLESIYGGNGGD